MKLSYQIKEAVLDNGIKCLRIEHPAGFESLSDLLCSDISTSSAQWYLDIIDRVSQVYRALNNVEVMLVA